MEPNDIAILGFILNTVSTVATVALAAWRLNSRLAKMQMKINLMWNWFKAAKGIQDGDD
jgi:hypothetical protein